MPDSSTAVCNSSIFYEKNKINAGPDTAYQIKIFVPTELNAKIIVLWDGEIKTAIGYPLVDEAYSRFDLYTTDVLEDPKYVLYIKDKNNKPKIICYNSLGV